MNLPRYITLEKKVGETPLSCAEAWRKTNDISTDVPLAYAGRLDPMASGKLLVLIGEECKQQEAYHGLDKAYDFSVLLGIGSDTHDVLGRLIPNTSDIAPTEEEIIRSAERLIGDIELPYPLFSAKTVQGKPLHTWTLENRLDEITIPTKKSTVFSLDLTRVEQKSREEVCDEALSKIETIPPVTEARKALGNDFRRADVRQDWNTVKQNSTLSDKYTVAHFHCIASSGTYMRTLAHVIGQNLHTKGLAWHIHRTEMGMYDPHTKTWTQTY